MIRISITRAAFDAIASTLPLGSVGYENEINERGPYSIPSLGGGVMLGAAWIDRPVDTQGLRSCFHVFLAQHGSAAMLKPMIDIPLASLRCAPRGFARTTRNG